MAHSEQCSCQTVSDRWRISVPRAASSAPSSNSDTSVWSLMTPDPNSNMHSLRFAFLFGWGAHHARRRGHRCKAGTEITAVARIRNGAPEASAGVRTLSIARWGTRPSSACCRSCKASVLGTRPMHRVTSFGRAAPHARFSRACCSGPDPTTVKLTAIPARRTRATPSARQTASNAAEASPVRRLRHGQWQDYASLTERYAGQARDGPHFLRLHPYLVQAVQSSKSTVNGGEAPPMYPRM